MHHPAGALEVDADLIHAIPDRHVHRAYRGRPEGAVRSEKGAILKPPYRLT